MKPALGGAKSEEASSTVPEPRDPMPFDDPEDIEDKEDIEEEELLGDRLGTEGDRRVTEDAEVGIIMPDLRIAAREKAGASVLANAGADLGEGEAWCEFCDGL